LQLTKSEKKLLDFLSESGEGMHIDGIAKNLGMSRVTASKHLATLEARGLVNCETIGVSKVYKRKRDERIIGEETRAALAKEIDALIEERLREKLSAPQAALPPKKVEGTKPAPGPKKSFEEQYCEVVSLAKKLAVIKLVRERKISVEKATCLSQISPEKLRLVAKAGGFS
jgi:predicted ArsR family transcriptional regulator